MGYFGYVALKLHNGSLYYADWTNTKRKYSLQNLRKSDINDLQRMFNSKTTIIIVNKAKVLKNLESFLGPIYNKKCVDSKNKGTAARILNEWIVENKKKKSLYNYQRDHWLSILSIINIQLMLRNEIPQSEVLKIIEDELNKYNRDMKPQIVFDKFLELGVFIRKKSKDFTSKGFIVKDLKTKYSNDCIYKEPMISLPDNKTFLTLG